MRLYIALIIAMIFLDECVSHSNSGVSYNNSEVIGCWKQSGTNLSYTYLIFKRDSTAIFESKADTIYRFIELCKFESSTITCRDSIDVGHVTIGQASGLAASVVTTECCL